MLYKINNDYSGRMQITTTAYDHKPTSEECRKMVFTSTIVSLDALSNFITEGYSYCPTDRKKDNVRESDFICIDVDGSDVDMGSFVSCITDTPSIYYTTPSDGDEEYALKKYGDRNRKYRFRLIYALSSPTKDAADYEKGYRYIVAANGLDRIAGFDDVVDFRVANQFYNGSKGCEIHNTHRVYTLPDEYRDVVPERKKKGSSPKPKQPKGGVRSDKIHSGTTLEANVRSEFLNCTKYEDYLEWYNGMFGESNLLRETPYLPDEEDERKLVCGDYYVIPKKYVGWDKVNKTKIYGKWLDGENRHTKIYITGIILRKLNPTASADDLLREIVAILMTYYNIFDPDRSLKFTPKNILQLLDSVMKADLTKELKEIKHPSFKVSSSYCERNRVSKRTVVNEILSEKRMEKKEKKYKEIDFFFDHNLTRENGNKITQKQWIEILKENGIEVSLATFKRYLKDRGYSKKRKKESIVFNTNTTTINTIGFSDDTLGEL